MSPKSRQRPSAEVARDAARAQAARDAAELRAIMTAQVTNLITAALANSWEIQNEHGPADDYPPITAVETMTQHGTPALTGDRPAGVRLRLAGGVEAVLMVDLRDIDPHRWEPIEPTRTRAPGSLALSKWAGVAQATDGHATTTEVCDHIHDARADAIACSRDLAVRLTVARA